MRKFLEIGGVVAAVVLIAFGIATIVMGMNARSTVRDSLKQEQIVGSPDMTPDAIAAEAKTAGLPANIVLPTKAVADEPITTGDEARTFASYMRIHTLLATGGQTYSQMGQYLDANGNQTSDPAKAAKDPKTGKPVPNQARDVWVTYTALSTALNTSYFAETVGVFGIVMGIALLLVGIGFLVLVLGGIERKPTTAATPTPTAAKS